MEKPFLGVIADDYTGATDIASMLVRGGMRTVQTIGIPSEKLAKSLQADAVVIALKSRSIAPEAAVAQSLEALARLQALGAKQIFFKYCSTFDSTPQGNIGPVSDALCAAIGAGTITHIPALPVNGRSVYQGHLFVGADLLNQSGMESHPLTPMTDANLVRWLGQQTTRRVALIGTDLLQQGIEAVQGALTNLGETGGGHVIGDTTRDSDLALWADVLRNAPLVAGGSGLATSLARCHMAGQPAQALAPPRGGNDGNTLILAGSCSKTTLAQIETFRSQGGQCIHLDPLACGREDDHVNTLLTKVSDILKSTPVLVYASGTPQSVQAVQEKLGREQAGALIEAAFAEIARQAVPLPQTNRLVVAGGETSGAVVSALGITALQIGPEIDPGVPWTLALDTDGNIILPIALKSGNFGAMDFFCKTLKLESPA
ncbi:four-carbon acid sugar kinase family protein [Paracoccaceae bacterium]|nr:four-carbon acid sugar kinase family protein [Paracoccaceae bacterium]